MKQNHKPEESTVIAYSQLKNLDLETARARLEKKYQAEVNDIDPKEIGLKVLKQMRVILPKVQGLEGRENDTSLKFKHLERAFWDLERMVDRLDSDNDLIKEYIKEVNNTINEQQRQMDILICGIIKQPNLLERLWTKISSILSK